VKASQVVTFLDSGDSLALNRRPPWPAQGLAGDSVHRVAAVAFGGPRRGQPPPVWPAPADAPSDQLAVLAGESAPTRPVAPRWDLDAWYQPVHFVGYDVGIFIREQSVVQLATELTHFSKASSAPMASPEESVGHVLREAFLALYLHAMFHHRVECLAIHMQVVGHRAYYADYVERAYLPAAASDDLLEEALANAYVYRMLSRRAHSAGVPTEVRRLTTAFLKQSWSDDRPGYRGAGRYTSPAAWDQGLGELHSRVEQGSNQPTRRAIWRHLGPDLTATFLDPSSDVYVVADPATLPVVPRAGQPDPSCTPDELVRVLEHAGYTTGRRARSPHVTLRAAGRPTAVVPTTEPLRPGVVAGNLGLIGALPADLPTLLAAIPR